MKLLRNHLGLILTVLVIGGLALWWTMSSLTWYMIGSHSMEPTLPVGSIVIVQPTDTLKPTDVITFQQEGDSRVTTHTFIGYDEAGNVQTKGDANLTPDIHTPPLTSAEVKGKVIRAIWLLTPQFWKSPYGTMAIASIVIIGLGVILGWKDTPVQSTTDTPRVTTPA